MKNIFLSIAMLASALLMFSQTVQADDSSSAQLHATIGFLPDNENQILQKNGTEIAKSLESKIGVPVGFYISKNYSDLVDAMKTKKIDFAFLPSLTFVQAEKSAGAKVLLKRVWEGPYYYSVLLTRGDSHLTNLSQLKGKKIAFVDRDSASGFLYPSVYFKKKGIDPSTYFKEIEYSGSHLNSVRMLADGKVDVIAVFADDAKAKKSAWTKFLDADALKKAGEPKVIWASGPIPNDPFCVRQDYYEAHPRTAHDLMFALIDLVEDTKNGSQFRNLLGGASLSLATSQQYDPVREMVKLLDIKQ